MYHKLDIINRFNNRVKINFKLLLLQLLLEDRRWVHANPTLYSAGVHKDKYKKYYVEDSSFLNDFYEAITDHKKFLVLQGKRGSGKTSFLNYFLNHKTRELNEKGLTWIRIDTTKLYKNRTSFSRNIDFKSYLYGQLLFVYFRYKGEEESCRTSFRCPHHEFILDSCDSVFHNIDLKKLIEDSSKSPHELERLNEVYEKAKNSALNTTHFNNSYDGKCFECDEIGKVLYDAVAEKLIIIIDGIDNINYNSSIKHDVWDDMVSFLNSIKDNTPLPYKIVIAMRNENHEILSGQLPYLKEREISSQNSSSKTLPNIFDLTSTKLKTIIERFKASIESVDISGYTEENYIETLKDVLKTYQEYLKKDLQINSSMLSVKEHMELSSVLKLPIDELSREKLEAKFGKAILSFEAKLGAAIKSKGYTATEKIERALRFLIKEEESESGDFEKTAKSKVLTHYFEYAINFEEELKQAISKRIQESGGALHHSGENFSVLTDLFNGDLREMFILSYHSYAYLMHFSMRDKKLGTFTDILHYMRGRDLSVLRAVFQNGNHYRGGREDVIFYPPYRNINFINLFNVLDSNKQESPPLVALYLLKYLYDKSATVGEIGRLFSAANIKKYPIEKILMEFLEFGYIGTSRADDGADLHYKTTAKGKNILDYSLTNLDIIQSYIYGGLVDERFKSLYRIWYDHNYVSQLLFNVLLFWYEIEKQEESLSELKKTFGIELDIIPVQAKKNFISLAKNFSEYHAMDDINNYTKGDKALAKNLKELYRRITFEGKNFDKLYEKSPELLSSKLSRDEKIIYLYSYLDKSPQEIIDHAKLHQFVFGDIDLDKEQERLETMKSVLEGNGYWDIRGELITKLEKINQG